MRWKLIKKEKTGLKEWVSVYKNTKYKLPNKQHISLDLYRGLYQRRKYTRLVLHPFSVNSPSMIYLSFDDLKYLFDKLQIKERGYLKKCLFLADKLLEIIHNKE